MTRVRMGVKGCGAIAQVQHLPLLTAMAEEFEVPIVCDVSPATAEYVARWFRVPRYVTDYRDLLASDVDAVLLYHTDPKTWVTVDAFNEDITLIIDITRSYITRATVAREASPRPA